jgi:hypothetical protein
MNPELFEKLLYQSESESLDFKKEQYPRLSLPDEAKSELLKDCVAFANSWRTEDGHILIGVEPVTGGKAKVVGTIDHFDDADLQQFVNGKTNRPVNFSYEVFSYEGKQVGVLTFKGQTRPVYLRNDFATKLRRNTVYVRRGSSTAEAAPEEQAEMPKGADDGKPVLDLQFYDGASHERRGTQVEVLPIVRIPMNDADLVDPPDPLAGIRDAGFAPLSRKEAHIYLLYNSVLQEVAFCVTNNSSKIARRVRLECVFPKAKSLMVRSERYYNKRDLRLAIGRVSLKSVSVAELPNSWRVTTSFGDIQPGVMETSAPFFIGAGYAMDVNLGARVFSDELLPQPFDFIVAITPSRGTQIQLSELVR